ncbi:outer membrane protein assembly factor BamA [Candidatus Magnetominusculus xianensis]|uniref:Outer membrane protein assembly factor BamA n=1 Tax=Candidatus Magnetominusculus xianensis TaxID=1748249 RepID=A0ABR5SL20_9BACT|nr:outer membrane protein assembly factor BamA [Candidatus Magnetominusculus xianensis]KWT95159.1 outer membrane protein Omp85 family protein [Candidatus Magnetominusculus xianensis]MBF0402806.1 outer membrane protein assembly factor BamA [Nitrospirota bacterium]
MSSSDSRLNKIPFALCVLVLMICLRAEAAQLATQAFEAATVSKITVTGLSHIAEQEFLYMFGIKVGDTIGRELIASGIKTAFLKGCFNDIRVSYKDGGVLSIEVIERPVIESVVVDASGPISSRKLRGLFTLKEDAEFHEALVEPAAAELKKTLAKKGLPHAKIKSDIIKGKKPAGVIIRLTIDEGQPSTIKSLVINTPVNNSELENILNIREGDLYDKDYIDEEIEKAKTLMIKKLLYFNPVVSEGVFDEATGTLTINIDPGKKLVLLFKGNDKISAAALKKEMPFVEYGSVSEDTIDEAIDAIEALYHKSGIINVKVGYERQDKQNEIELVFSITEGEAYTIADIVFTGATLNFEKLYEAMLSKKDSPYNPDIDEDDEDALVSCLHNEGYTAAAVKSYKAEINEGRKSVTLHVEIDEGSRLVIKDVKVVGTHETDSEQVLAAADIKIGRPYVETEIFNARQTALTYLTHQGYVEADVKIERQGDSPEITVILHITEGKKYSFGDTIVRGNTRTNWEVFRRVLKHTKGEPLNMAVVYGEMRELYKTSLFTSIDISAVDAGEGVKDIVFDVKEADAGTIDYGLGYGDYEGPRGFFEIKYINLQGMNRQIAFKARLSQIARKLSLTYDEPWFLGNHLPFNATLLYERKEERNLDSNTVLYRTEKYTSSVGIGKNITEKLKAALSYEFSLTNTWDVQPDVVLTNEDTGTLAISSIVPSLIYDARDNPFNPTSGILAGATVKVASKALMSQTNFAKLSGYVNFYQGLSKGLILALSLRSGIGKGWSNTEDMPIIERFFLGGSTTVRGYSQDNLGPKGSSGDPTGGNAYLMGNAEMRISVIDNFGLVTFIDLGDVWSKISDYSLSSLKYTTGLGLRYMTAAGPIRLDYGYKLNRGNNEGTGRFYFSIGQAF